MKKNIGNLDKVIRLIIAVFFLYLGYNFNVWWYLPALILAITILLGHSFLYDLFKLNTFKAQAQRKAKLKRRAIKKARKRK